MFKRSNNFILTRYLPNTSSLAVSGLPGTVADVNVEMYFSHTSMPDLDVFLLGPDDTRVELFTDVGTLFDWKLTFQLQ